MTKDRDPSIEELCRPLSAKIMPASAKYSVGGKTMSPKLQKQYQRRMRRQAPKAKPARKAS